jgi:hypothetical protein
MATNTSGGEEKYAYIEFPKLSKVLLRDGRTVFLPSFYVKHGHDSKERHQAALLTPDLAAQIAALYPDKSPKIHDETRHTDDSTAPLPKELFELGEAVSAQELESTVRAALRVLKKNEVQTILDKVLQESA